MKLTTSILGLGLILLAACEPATPKCVAPSAKQLVSLDKQITDTRRKIDRANGVVTDSNTSINLCIGGGGNNVFFDMCRSSYGNASQYNPIVAEAETENLQILLNQREELARQVAAEQAICAQQTTG